MNKALPWNINGVGFDAREAAREAARRQGKSLGEWLHAVIADHASELGVEEREIIGQDRVDAVTSRLERMSARPAPFDRRPRDERADERPRARPSRRDLDDEPTDAEETFRRRVTQRDRAGEPRRGRPAAIVDETEFLLEEAIESMERRAARVERRTDDALASFAQMFEKNEARRERERASVATLTEKLSEIETRLGDTDQSPIKGALARLEARLETIGRRTVAEAAVKQNVQALGSESNEEGADSIRRLEEKLNAVLDAVATRPAPQPLPLAASTSTIAIAASREAPQRQRRLGDAIAEIADRQRRLDDPNAPSVPMAPRHRERPFADALPRPNPLDQAASVAPHSPVLTAMQGDIAALTAKIDDMHRAIAHRASSVPAERGPDLDHLHRQIAAMTRTLGDLAARPPVRETRPPVDPSPALGHIEDQMREIRDLISANTPRAVDFEPIETKITLLTDRLNQQSRERAANRANETAAALAAFEARFKARPQETVDVGSLESMVRDLGAKIEAVQAPGAGSGAIEALQDQIGALSARFERSETGFASLTGLERSMQDLFAHLEETRASVEVSAAAAARDAVRMATAHGTSPDPAEADRAVAAVRAMQDEADARTQSTLQAVHETLEKVVDRLSLMEGDIADVRARPKLDPAETPRTEMPRAVAPRPEPVPTMPAREVRAKTRPTADMALGGADPLFDPMFGRKPSKEVANPLRGRPTDLDEEAGRADFIAAARRAAQAAQTDASVMAMKAPQTSPDDVRAGLAAKSRDYVSSHKRPVLLSLAALFVIIGTMAVMSRVGFDDIANEVADYRAPAKIVRMASSSRPVQTASTSQLGELTPSALPRSTPPLSDVIPGSDPITTGSIPTPSLARSAVTTPPPAMNLPAAIQGLPSFAAQGAAPILPPRPSLPAGLVAMADAGNGAAEFELAARYADGKAVPRDYKLAAKWYEKAADRGLAPAQYRLASLYEKGLGVAQDKVKAKSLYMKAAEAGNPRAMHNLAVLLADGNGKPDYEGAATWFRKAAQYGIHDSQYNLAILLARGLGVQQSLVQSYQWFAVAADQHDSDAAAKRDEVAAKLNANDLSVAKALAAAFHPRSADLAATDVQPPAGGWDGASIPSPLNSARAKISSL